MALNNQSLNKAADKAADNAKPKAPKVQTANTAENARIVSESNEVDPSIVGSLAKSIAVTDLLGDPSDKDRTYTKEGEGENAKTVEHVRSRVIGYRVKNVGDKPIDINEFGLGEDWQRGPDHRLNRGASRGVYSLKPGESRDLTIAELAILLARPEFNRGALGGNYPLRASFAPKKARNDDATLSADQSMSFRVNPVVEGDTSSFTLSDMPMVDILEATWGTTPKGQSRVDRRVILPEFEDKFAPVARKATNTRGQGRRSSAPAEEKYDQNASLFLRQALSSVK